MAEQLEQNQNNEEIKVDELDDKELEDASGGLEAPTEDTTNNGCNCSCG
jgi:hypothetical protein